MSSFLILPETRFPVSVSLSLVPQVSVVGLGGRPLRAGPGQGLSRPCASRSGRIGHPRAPLELAVPREKPWTRPCVAGAAAQDACVWTPLVPPAAMNRQVRNGSSLGGEHLTDLLVFGFLQHGPSDSFQEELKRLGHTLPTPAGPEEHFEEELQTDGSRCSRFVSEGPDTGSETQEDVIRNIARQLAQIGDVMDQRVPPSLVDHLVRQLRDRSLSEEGRRAHLATAVEQVLQACPRDMEEEKAMLLVTMLLARKVASHTPSLLREVFHTTVGFINQNLLTYVRNLVRNEMD
ncbi:BH3-interacting domain death agonist isoform 2-T2 [Glossophaga mutica]